VPYRNLLLSRGKDSPTQPQYFFSLKERGCKEKKKRKRSGEWGEKAFTTLLGHEPTHSAWGTGDEIPMSKGDWT